MWYIFIFQIAPKGSGNNHTPFKPLEDSYPTYNEMEYISLRVSNLEYMIKGNVKMDDLVKLENKMASKEGIKRMDSKEDLKGMYRKEDLQELKELMKDIKNSFIPHVSIQEEDKDWGKRGLIPVTSGEKWKTIGE